jgi:hypothetical protein
VVGGAAATVGPGTGDGTDARVVRGACAATGGTGGGGVVATVGAGADGGALVATLGVGTGAGAGAVVAVEAAAGWLTAREVAMAIEPRAPPAAITVVTAAPRAAPRRR